ncbi:MAG TPA: TRAP transporter small permease [Burkholderiales bacterium]|jgi:TRAP-type C4-dicarboxylate transport system permease small subunit|nr:TRAP transporter small permease [Burkholderiales bacterium]
MSVLRAVDGVVARCERGAAVGLLAVTVVIVVLQVFFRYVLNSSLSWTEEAARYLFIWAAVLGFSSSVEAGRLFRFEMIAAHLPAAGRRVCQLLFAVAAAAFLWALIFSGGALVAGTMSQTSPAMNIPMALPYAALPAGGVLIALHFIAALGAPAASADGSEGAG